LGQAGTKCGASSKQFHHTLQIERLRQTNAPIRREHLYRNHALPVFCRRCYTIFKTDSLLDDHLRVINPCGMRPREKIEGFDKLQHERLRSRKKSPTESSEEDKWRDVYRILFPFDDESIMPSPCQQRSIISMECTLNTDFICRP
jgi:hypothetical protein